MSSNIKLNEIFEGFDNSEPLPASLSNLDLERLSKQSTIRPNNNKSEAPKTKKDGIIAIVKKVESAINNKLPIGKEIKVDLTFTASLVNSAPDGGKKGVFVQSKKNNDVAMNINIKRLSKLPSLEVYSIIYNALYRHSVQNEAVSDNNFDLDAGVDENTEVEEPKKKKSSKDKAIECLAGYLNKFLPKYFDGKFKEFSAISKLVAIQIVDEMDEEDFEKILSVFFKFEKLDKKAENLVEEFLGSSETSRLEYINYKATEFLLDPNKEQTGLNYLQQAEELLSVSTKTKFQEAVNSNGKSLNDFKSFCVSYANRFMYSNNLNGIEVTFEPEGALGEFYDDSPPRINVNLKRIDSVSELAMTLSHELTHAVDSCLNKSKGKYNRDGGGLIDTISEDISDSGLKESDPAYKLLKELKNYCYHINPNERHARIGELSALSFIDEMSKDNTGKNINLRSQLFSSASKYISYQNRTAEMINNLSSAKISAWRDMLAGFNKIPSHAKNMINERIDYLEGMLESGLMIDAEKESIEAARRIVEAKQKEIEDLKLKQEAIKKSETTQMGE